MNLISKFDPWNSCLCTCPAKLTFNPYTGCDHKCIYCYASSYIPRFFECRPKKDLTQRLRKEASNLRGEIISISNSSDPYASLDGKLVLMRKCLEILTEHNCRLQIITKSDLVVRDIDLLRKVRSMVSLTITTDQDELTSLIEPNAPSSSDRLKAAEKLVKEGIPTSVRIDPVIPHVNDNPESLISTLADIGVRHVTCSTYKVRWDNWQRFKSALPDIAEKLDPIYFDEGDRIGGYIYLPRDLRLRLMLTMRRLAEKHGMKFGVCREGLSGLNTASCDGSWMLRTHS